MNIEKDVPSLAIAIERNKFGYKFIGIILGLFFTGGVSELFYLYTEYTIFAQIGILIWALSLVLAGYLFVYNINTTKYTRAARKEIENKGKYGNMEIRQIKDEELMMRKKPSYDENVKCFNECKKLAEEGNVTKQFTLGHAYYTGTNITEVDNKEAFKWFKKAAEGENLTAQTILSQMYRTGIGTEKNYKEAYIWWSIAVARGWKDKYYFNIVGEKIISKLTDEELEDVKKEAKIRYDEMCEKCWNLVMELKVDKNKK